MVAGNNSIGGSAGCTSSIRRSDSSPGGSAYSSCVLVVLVLVPVVSDKTPKHTDGAVSYASLVVLNAKAKCRSRSNSIVREQYP